MRKYVYEAHAALKRIYADKTFGDEALTVAGASPMGTKLVYGVLENDILLDYILSQCIERKPRLDAMILLKIGTYALRELDDVPDYAIVSECVEVCKNIPNANGASGFVNAVLKRVAKKQYELPREGDKNYLSVMTSTPQWMIDRLEREYSKEIALEIVTAPPCEFEHIRVNGKTSSMDEVTGVLKSAGEEFSISDAGGIIARMSDCLKPLFQSGKITYQSPSSMLAVRALNAKRGDNILDMCAAPGGKSVYLSELIGDGRIVACDVNPARLKQIEKYAERMGATGIVPVLHDGTTFNPRFKDAFDKVLVDAPCSCFGTFKKHPDIFLRRNEKDIPKLAAIQKELLKNAAQYVKPGGTLVYSTCSVFDEENRDAIKSLLVAGRFTLQKIGGLDDVAGGRYAHSDGSVRILPIGIYDGFYIAKMRRNK